MIPFIQEYNQKLSQEDKKICDLLATTFSSELPDSENKIWHAHPVWFIDGNPIEGYSKLKDAVRLMFWRGADFGETKLKPGSGKFKDASVKYVSPDQIDLNDLKRWLKKSIEIQWDYKNVIKRKGLLERLK